MLLLIEICVVPARSLHYKKCFRYFRPNLSLIKTQENNTNIPTCKLSIWTFYLESHDNSDLELTVKRDRNANPSTWVGSTQGTEADARTTVPELLLLVQSGI